MYVLLAVHFTQLLFLRRLYDDHGKVITKYWYVWLLHLLVFIYVIRYYLHGINEPKADQNVFISRRVWIPMDCILTCSIGTYYLIHYYYFSNDECADEALFNELSSSNSSLDHFLLNDSSSKIPKPD